MEEPGQPFNLTCVVRTIPGLVAKPQVKWSRNSGYSGNAESSGSADSLEILAVATGNRNTLHFDALHTSDAGTYVCDATVSINSVNLMVQNSATKQLSLQSKF